MSKRRRRTETISDPEHEKALSGIYVDDPVEISEAIPPAIPSTPKTTKERTFDPEYASLSEVFLAVISTGFTENIRALEFGAGHYSTPELIACTARAVSVEKSQDWINRLEADHGTFDHHEFIQADEPARVKIDFSEFDLVIVDGETEDRVKVANRAFSAKVPVVMVHDTDKVSWYGYHRLTPGFYYTRIDFELESPSRRRTSVYVATGIASRFEDISPDNHVRVNG